ncbi:MAG: family 78 glycoside hydrolase catalytic domain, partial [Mucilaginibacter sp.]
MRRILLFLFILTSAEAGAQLNVAITLCENKPHPLGVPCQDFRLGWEIKALKRSEYQTAFQIVISTSEKHIDQGIYDVWNSATVHSSQSVLVAYKGKALRPATVYYWKVKVWDKFGKPSSWSKLSSFCTGLENSTDWHNARWIGYEDLADSMRVAPGVDDPSADRLKNKPLYRPVTPLLRKEFKITRNIKSAFAFISGLGQYDLFINGTKAGNGFLTPGWTYYDKRCLYNVLDITSLLKNGSNCAGAMLGNGFFNINRERYTKFVDAFGMPKMICRILINYEDGSTREIISDQSWKVSPSPILFNSIYGGEDYDANLEQLRWDQPGFDDNKWKHAKLVRAPTRKLVADMDYPVTAVDSFCVKTITEPKRSVFVYDFGQNASGIVELKIRGHKGQTVKLIPCEILTGNKLANQHATGSPYYFSYTLKGDSTETWMPQFTYYGFRYVQVEGAKPDTSGAKNLPVIVKLMAIHTRNAAPTNGSFECSNELFNRIYTLINWAIKSNLQSVITDCPHREKLSWLEQDYLMGASIHYNFDNYSVYHKLVFDLADAQQPNGLVPDIAPEYVKFDGGFRDSPEWGSS